MKSSYESQIQEMQDEKDQLLIELQDWKSRAHASATVIDQLQQQIARDLSPSSAARFANQETDVPRKMSKLSSLDNEKKSRKKTSSIRSQLTASMDNVVSNIGKVSTDSESTAFSSRMQNRKESTEKNSSKRSPLGNHNSSANQQPLFPPKSGRPLSPARSRSPLSSPNQSKRSNSPINKAPYISKGLACDENTAMNKVPMFGQVQAGITEATSSDGSTYFKRLRSNFQVRA